MFSAVAGKWHEATRQLGTGGMWAALESAAVRCHRLRSGTFKQPRATTQLAAEEPRRASFGRDAVSSEVAAATLRESRLQQWLALEGRPECSGQLQQLKAATAKDPEPSWAVVGKLELPRAFVEELVERAKAEEDKALAESRAARRTSWRRWCFAQTEEGPPSGGSGRGPAAFSSRASSCSRGASMPGRRPCWPLARRLGGRCSGTRRPRSGIGSTSRVPRQDGGRNSSQGRSFGG
jgi:hypothetical protein